MPGLYGIVSFSTPPDLGRFQNLGSDVPPANGRIYQLKSPVALLGLKSLGIVDSLPQPFPFPDRDLSLLLWGEILSFENSNSDRPHEMIFQLYLQERFEKLVDLNGSCAFALWDNRRQRLSLGSDLFATRPIYYTLHNDQFLFASNLFDLAKAAGRRNIDAAAMAEFLSTGMITDDKTWVDGICKLRYAECLQFDRAGLRTFQYFQPRIIPVTMSIREAAEEIVKRLDSAVKRSLRGKTALSLSGGGDSRLLAAILLKNGSKLPTFTYGAANTEDQLIASQVEQHLQLDHHTLNIPLDYLSSSLRDATYNTSGATGATNFHGFSTRTEVKQFADICLSGIGGNNILGYLSGGLWRLSRLGTKEKFTIELAKWLNSGFTDTEFPLLIKVETSFNSIEHAAQLLSQYPHDDPFDSLTVIDQFEVNSRRSFAGLWLESDTLEFRTPFCDHELTRFCLTVPSRHKLWMKLGRFIWQDHFPDLGKIPYQRTGIPLNAPLYRIILQKGYERISGNRRPVGIFDYGLAFKQPLHDWLPAMLLAKDTRSLCYLHRDTVASLIENHRLGSQNNASKLGLLLTFEQVLRLLEG